MFTFESLLAFSRLFIYERDVGYQVMTANVCLNVEHDALIISAE